MSTIQNRYDFVYLFDIENGNPNGDPDAGNLPRLDPETNLGLVTDVCLKRKVRNFVEISKGNSSKGYEIYVREKAILTNQRKRAFEDRDEKPGKGPDEDATAWMCQTFYDIRTFGAVMSFKKADFGQVRGPVQFSFGTSIEPVVPLDITITRMAVETEEESKKQDGGNRTMGRKHIVPYGLYRMYGFISANLAQKTAFSDKDLDLLWESLLHMFEHDRSAARGLMSARKLIIFKHDNALGHAPAHALFKRVHIERKENSSSPARCFDDYNVSVDTENFPGGMEIIEKL